MDWSQPRLAKLVEFLGDNQFLAGDNVTWLDFFFVENVDMLDKLSQGSFFTEFPTLKAYHERMFSLDKLS